MSYKPRNRNMSGHDGRNSTARWFDDRQGAQQHPCGFQVPPCPKPTDKVD